jgi:hypothetical protein
MTMHNHHRYTSFKTFSTRVLGIDSIPEEDFESTKGTLSFASSIKSEDSNAEVVSKLNSSKSSYESRSSLVNATNQTSFIASKTIKYNEEVSKLLDEIKMSSAELVANHLGDLKSLLRMDYSVTTEIEYEISCLIADFRYIENALDVIVDITLLMEQEEILLNVLLSNLSKLFENSNFIGNARNVRILQQFLSVHAIDHQEVGMGLCSISLPASPKAEDAFVAVVISVASKACNAAEIFLSQKLLSANHPVRFYERTIETLSRSPIKLNYASEVSLLKSLILGLSPEKTAHAKLLFRASYFCRGELNQWLSDIDFSSVLTKVFSFSDREFNELYRDVRRSQEKPISKNAFLALLESIDVASLSVSKVVYLFTLVPSDTSDAEKLSLMCKVLIDKGVPVINSQEGLTLSASLGLKQLSSEIINETLNACGALPVLPQTTNYRLSDVFQNVLMQEVNINDQYAELISVVITTFNPELEYFEMALKSVVQQDAQNVEIIVIDDCSEVDKSKSIEQICKSVSVRNVVYKRNDVNVGQYISRNTAIGLASGNYIAIQDDDDVSHPQRLSMQVDALNRRGGLACFTKHVRYSDDGHLSVDDPRNLLVYGDGPATLLFKRSLVDMVGGFRNYRSRGDIDFRTRVESIAGERSITRVDAPLYFMRSSLSTISSLYEYFNGDQLVFFRRRINMFNSKKATEKVDG